MGLYADRILPRLLDLGMRGEPFLSLRPRVLAGVSGRVLEVGFGSGLNLPHYPPGVEHLLALEPALLGRELARKRVEHAPFPVEFVGLDGASIPLEEGSVDAVVSTWTLCTIPDVERALAEVRRVLRPGGRLHFVEHGRSPSARVARWQGRLNGLQKALFGGCHLDREIDRLVVAAGLELEAIERFDVAKTPRTHGHTYLGVARRGP